ncbi:MAG: hypothetical protein KDB80_13510 [Planctomycetes bacterium]|nr:hypothetical protein [Planctomycetota bacterium]
MHSSLRPNPLSIWLLIGVVMLAACVPAGGLTICVHESHSGIGALGTGHGCPCDADDHPVPDDDHHDLEVDSLEGAPNPSDVVVVAAAAPIWLPTPLALPVPRAADTRALEPRNRGPTDPDHLRIVRTVVLLI